MKGHEKVIEHRQVLKNEFDSNKSIFFIPRCLRTEDIIS